MTFPTSKAIALIIFFLTQKNKNSCSKKRDSVSRLSAESERSFLFSLQCDRLGPSDVLIPQAVICLIKLLSEFVPRITIRMVVFATQQQPIGGHRIRRARPEDFDFQYEVSRIVAVLSFSMRNLAGE